MEGSGKAQAELYDDFKKRGRSKVRRPSTATVVFIVATIALAAVSISLLGLAERQTDSRDRSQCWLVKSLSESISHTAVIIEGAVDSSNEDFTRIAIAVAVNCMLTEADDIAYSINLMYPDGSLESEMFDSVHLAIRQTQIVIEKIENHISNALENDRSWETNSTITSSISNVSSLLTDLSGLIYAGIDSSQDFLKDPYSPVKRMDLEAIKALSKEIENAMIELASLL